VGIGVPLAGIAAAWWWGRAHTTLRPRHLGWIAAAAVVGMALFFAWAIPANAATGGGLARGGIGHHVVRRMLEPLEGHGGSPVLYLPYYLVVIAAGFFPWTLYLPGAVSALARGRLASSGCPTGSLRRASGPGRSPPVWWCS
jgi:4-amino-4-deoxy-L-arabinose transferase-like glycosyltransferase